MKLSRGGNVTVENLGMKVWNLYNSEVMFGEDGEINLFFVSNFILGLLVEGLIEIKLY